MAIFRMKAIESVRREAWFVVEADDEQGAFNKLAIGDHLVREKIKGSTSTLRRDASTRADEVQSGPGGVLANNEVAIKLPNGMYLAIPDYEDNPEGCDYVRVLDRDDLLGNEIAYWTYTEWQEDPQLVMGAIFGAGFGPQTVVVKMIEERRGIPK